MKSFLLAPYLEINQRWVDLAEVVQAITQEPIENVNRYISWIRHQYITEDAANVKIEAGQMLSSSDFTRFDDLTTISQANLAGFAFKNNTILPAAGYTQILRDLPAYWFTQGTKSFIDFFSFVMNTPFTLTPLWTQDYVTFLPEGDSGIGTPLYNGGTWYPTTHVQLGYDSVAFSGFNHDDIVSFFYYFANYNLVLHTTISTSEIDMNSIGMAMAFGTVIVTTLLNDLYDPTDSTNFNTELLLLELPNL